MCYLSDGLARLRHFIPDGHFHLVLFTHFAERAVDGANVFVSDEGLNFSSLIFKLSFRNLSTETFHTFFYDDL